MASLLKKFVDAEQWDAEDIAGRLGMVLHAAFLFAGFQPYGAQPRSGHLLKKQSRKKNKGGSLCLSRQYTAPDLSHRDGADAVVLMLCAQGSDVALLVFLTTGADGDDDTAVPENAYLERLDLGTVRPLLSRSLDGVEPWASRICKSLANGVCWGFLGKLRRRNGLPPMTGFASLPDDLKGAVLEKLTDGKDLARVECVSSQLRLLVAERNHELWKTMYKALRACQRQGCWHQYLFCFNANSSDKEHETLNLRSSWKDKYVEARQCSYPFFILNGRCIRRTDEVPVAKNLSPWPPFIIWEDGKRLCRIFIRRRKSSWLPEYWLSQHPAGAEEEEEEEEIVSMRVGRSGSHRRKLARNDYKNKWNSGGAIHSPSSRYRWKHR